MKRVKEYRWEQCRVLNKKLTGDFLDYAKTEKQLRKKSMEIYEIYLPIWFYWLKEHGGNRLLPDIRHHTIRKYEKWLYDQDASDYEVRSAIQAVNNISRYVAEQRKDEFPHFARRFQPYRILGRAPVRAKPKQ